MDDYLPMEDPDWLRLPIRPPERQDDSHMAVKKGDVWLQTVYPDQAAHHALVYMYWMWEESKFRAFCPYICTAKKLHLRRSGTWLYGTDIVNDCYSRAPERADRAPSHWQLWHKAHPTSEYRRRWAQPTRPSSPRRYTSSAFALAGLSHPYSGKGITFDGECQLASEKLEVGRAIKSEERTPGPARFGTTSAGVDATRTRASSHEDGAGASGAEIRKDHSHAPATTSSAGLRTRRESASLKQTRAPRTSSPIVNGKASSGSTDHAKSMDKSASSKKDGHSQRPSAKSDRRPETTHVPKHAKKKSAKSHAAEDGESSTDEGSASNDGRQSEDEDDQSEDEEEDTGEEESTDGEEESTDEEEEEEEEENSDDEKDTDVEEDEQSEDGDDGQSQDEENKVGGQVDNRNADNASSAGSDSSSGDSESSSGSAENDKRVNDKAQPHDSASEPGRAGTGKSPSIWDTVGANSDESKNDDGNGVTGTKPSDQHNASDESGTSDESSGEESHGHRSDQANHPKHDPDQTDESGPSREAHEADRTGQGTVTMQRTTTRTSATTEGPTLPKGAYQASQRPNYADAGTQTFLQHELWPYSQNAGPLRNVAMVNSWPLSAHFVNSGGMNADGDRYMSSFSFGTARAHAADSHMPLYVLAPIGSPYGTSPFSAPVESRLRDGYQHVGRSRDMRPGSTPRASMEYEARPVQTPDGSHLRDPHSHQPPLTHTPPYARPTAMPALDNHQSQGYQPTASAQSRAAATHTAGPPGSSFDTSGYQRNPFGSRADPFEQSAPTLHLRSNIVLNYTTHLRTIRWLPQLIHVKVRSGPGPLILKGLRGRVGRGWITAWWFLIAMHQDACLNAESHRFTIITVKGNPIGNGQARTTIGMRAGDRVA
ncbi:hypothetical protein KVT40_008050 [Elsinoe batatas]|uniref:Uncharacterized protein n=1 Tax=Elsinoe batatas TaxID=2601811 RepID=A0A8K0KSL1_9PEZI|nr:hypothetical protein KVT40_008050 [Elsinoe batatas]